MLNVFILNPSLDENENNGIRDIEKILIFFWNSYYVIKKNVKFGSYKFDRVERVFFAEIFLRLCSYTTGNG